MSVQKVMQLKVELDFQDPEEMRNALEQLALILKNWNNVFTENPNNKIKYFAQEQE